MRTHPILLLAVGLTLAACDDSGGPSTDGTLVVSTSTGGNDPDPDGYLLAVDGVDTLVLDLTGTIEIDLPAGQHSLQLHGVAAQCAVAPTTPLEVDVPPRGTTPVAFEINCQLTGARIRTTTHRPGHRLRWIPCGRGWQRPGNRFFQRHRAHPARAGKPNDWPDGPCTELHARRPRLANGDHRGHGGRADRIRGGMHRDERSDRGVVEAVGNGRGRQLRGDGGRGGAFFVGPGGPSVPDGVSAGDHVVSLVAPANCSVEGDPQSVTVTAGGLIRDTVEVAFTVTCVAPPASARIAFVRRSQPGHDGMAGPPDIYLANADGSEATRLTSGENPAWSPDGRRIAFNREGTIHVIDAEGSNERPVGPGGFPAWSPDGTRIVFKGFFDSDDGIFVMNADGSGLHRLISGDFANPGSHDEVAWPEWSPDGRQISFVRTPEYDSFEPWALYVMNADGSNPRNLDVLRSVEGGLAEVHNWSPDGSRIAFGVILDVWTIASVSSSGDEFRVHHRDQPEGVATHPDWSPDGRYLVFNRYVTTSGCEIPSCPMRIFVVSTEGGPARQLIPELPQAPAYWDHQPAWSRANE